MEGGVSEVNRTRTHIDGQWDVRSMLLRRLGVLEAEAVAREPYYEHNAVLKHVPIPPEACPEDVIEEYLAYDNYLLCLHQSQYHSKKPYLFWCADEREKNMAAGPKFIRIKFQLMASWVYRWLTT